MKQHKKTAVVMAWRKGEDDLNATIEAAGKSAGPNCIVLPVEDKTGDGPARTRHRGLLAAMEHGCEVVAVVDAHMRFKGQVLNRMMMKVADAGGGLLCAKCYHNPQCSFDGKHPSGASYYAGAEIAYRARYPHGEQNALCWKWSKDPKPGPRGCIGGACYVFPVAWYFEIGAPWSALYGWGCDEESLSISAWLSGIQPQLFDGAVAHRYREKTPWKKTHTDEQLIWSSRMSMIHAVVADPRDRADLVKWQTEWIPPGERKYAQVSKEAEEWRLALLRQPRAWAQWKATVAQPDAIETKGKSVPVSRPVNTPVPVAPKANYGADETDRHCRKCGSPHSEVTRTVRAFRSVVRYRKCSECGVGRVTREICATV